jgi:hypothetical protein
MPLPVSRAAGPAHAGDGADSAVASARLGGPAAPSKSPPGEGSSEGEGRGALLSESELFAHPAGSRGGRAVRDSEAGMIPSES